MKNIFLVIIALLTVQITFSQDRKVPDAVIATFEKKYPGENDPDFELDSHGFWEAHFKINGIKYRADFNADGSWVETENSIKYKELPKAVRTAIENEYKDAPISEVEHVMSASKGEFYDVEFKQKGKNRDVEYRADGSKLLEQGSKK